jgi:hypothetical protein
MPRMNCSPLAIAAFQRATGHRNQRVQTARPHRTSASAGAGISVRPFARSQRRFRHHCEVYVPGLHLRFPVRKLCESVRSPAPSLRSVSRPNRGDLFARNPLSASISNVPDLSPVSTPLQVLFEDPPDQSVQPVQFQEARPTGRSIASTPHSFLFRFHRSLLNSLRPV